MVTTEHPVPTVNEDLAQREESFRAKVTDLSTLADGIVQLRLQPAASQGSFPPWEPGAHVDVILPDGTIRQYSLCGEPSNAHEYQLAVLREPNSRGGSRQIHEDLSVGTELDLIGPRNNFQLVESDKYIFIAGGIGITPILTMIEAVDKAGAEWQLIYGGRAEATMAYRDRLEKHADKVIYWPEDQFGLIDLDRFLGTPHDDTLIYCCGPEPLLNAVEARCQKWKPNSLHLERFVPLEVDTTGDTSFQVELRQSNMTLEVPADKSILDTVTDAGVFVPRSCTEGTCGSCETPVLSGTPDHRDVVLSPEEQEASETMMLCVSRAKCPRLVLDI